MENINNKEETNKKQNSDTKSIRVGSIFLLIVFSIWALYLIKRNGGLTIGSVILLVLSLIFLFAIIGTIKKNKEKNIKKPANKKSDSSIEKTSINRPNYFQLAKKMQLLPEDAKSVSNGEIWPNIPKIGKYDGLIGMFLLVIHHEKKANTSHCQRIIKIQSERAYDIMQQLVELGFISQTGTKDYRINFTDFNKVLNKLENLKN